MTELSADVPAEVREFLEAVTPAKRRRDAATLVTLFTQVTGETPALWGTIVGYGTYHYRYESGREGDAPAAGFAPRKAATSVYLSDGVGAHEDLLERVGPHTTGVGCLYLKDLEQNDLGVLREIVGRSYTSLAQGTYTQRAREGGPG